MRFALLVAAQDATESLPEPRQHQECQHSLDRQKLFPCLMLPEPPIH